MKKICYVVTIPLTIRSFFIPQLRYLSENGFDVTVICSDDGKIKDELGNSVKFIPVDIPRGLSFAGSIAAIWKLKKVFQTEKFDLIQYSTPNASLYASIAARMVGCQNRNYHLMGLRYLGASGVGKTILKIVEKIACSNSTTIECVSKSNMDMGIEEGLFPEQKVTVVWNGSTGGVDVNRFDCRKRNQWRTEVRHELNYSGDDFIYGFVGRITKDKGINELMEAFIALGSNDKLLLVGPKEGEDTLDQDLLEMARANPNIQMHDVVTDVERYYAAIDVLVLPSYREGFGNVVIEAGAVGTPAIVSNIPGPIDTVIPNETALLVPVKDSIKLREALKCIKHLDYKEMGKRASEFVSSCFDSGILCEKIMDRKNQLLQK